MHWIINMTFREDESREKKTRTSDFQSYAKNSHNDDFLNPDRVRGQNTLTVPLEVGIYMAFIKREML